MRAAGNDTFTCDASGNVVGGTALANGRYDFENRPWRIERLAGGGLPAGQASYQYGPSGDRFKEITGSQTTWYGATGFEQTLGGAQTTNRIELGPVTLTKTGTVTSVQSNLKDRLGSTVVVHSAVGALWETRSYDAFGKPRNGDQSDRPTGTLALSPTTLRGFTGHEHVDDVRLIHMNGRMYDPLLGRFLSVDPIIQFPSNSQSLNPYSYVLNNPLAGKDPSGYVIRGVDSRSLCFTSPGSCGAIYKTDTVTALGALVSTSSATGNGADHAMTPSGMLSVPSSPHATDINQSGKTVMGKQLAQVEPAEGRVEEEGRAEVDSIRSEIRRESLRKRGISPVGAPTVEGNARQERDRLVEEMLKYDSNYRVPDTVGAGGEANNPIDQRDVVRRDLLRARVNDVATGGVYLLRDPASGEVMRSGRTNNFNRRQAEHGNNPVLKELEFEPLFRTDVYTQQRGLEQFTHEQFQPPLNRISPISPTNPRRQEYIDAAHDYLKEQP